MNTYQLDNIVPAMADTAVGIQEKAGLDKVVEPEAVAIPTDFICPITLQIMESPVMTRAGVNFERSAIIAWLQKGSGVCPMTRTPLLPKDIVANIPLENRIRHWCAANAVQFAGCKRDELDKAGFIGFVPINHDKHKKLLKRIERRIHEIEVDGSTNTHRHRRHRSVRQGSSRQASHSRSDRSERVSTAERSAGRHESTDRFVNYRHFVACAKRAAAA
jgi:hypothetical protein